MKTFIRVAEVWVPDRDGSLLEFGGGLYGSACRFGSVSPSLCFGRGEGLPGQAWESGRPVMLKKFEGANFRRTQAAAADGLTCGIALPFFADDHLTSVLVLFCGDDEEHAGAIELWHNDPGKCRDMTLDDGYYGTTADAFEFISRRTSFRPGTGLPGIAWETGLPVFMPDLGKGGRFLRADGAIKVGINRGFALPCATPGKDVFVMAFLSALATPLVQRFEIWLPEPDGSGLRRQEGFCEKSGVIDGGGEFALRGQGAIGRALATRVPMVGERAQVEPGSVGVAAREAGLESMLAVPVLRAGRVTAVVAWYF
jgi:hypothetical protein